MASVPPTQSGTDVPPSTPADPGILRTEPVPPQPLPGGDDGEGPASPDGPEATAGPPGAKPAKPKRKLSFLQELPVLLLVAFLLALLIKTFLVQAFYIPSESMDPTLKIGDRVLVNKLVYHFHPPRRGDIIVFSDPHPVGLGLSTSPEKDFIKRVIGLPGDRVEVRVGANGVGVVYVNDVPLREPYLNALKETRPYGPVTVPAGDLFVMGDNRMNSNDSRYGLGFIPADKVVGRAFIIIWPPSRFRWLSGINYS